MKTKIEISNVPGVSELAYPCIKQSITDRTRIVLFTGPQTGTAISEYGAFYGVHHASWAEEMFEPFVGSITITCAP